MIKKLMILFIISINLIGCNNMDTKNSDVLLYKTKEYEAFEKKAKVSIKEAITLICKDSKYKPFLQHYLIYKDKYVFTSLPPTHAGTLVLSEGLTVDKNTGEINIINNSTFKDKRVQIENSLPVKCNNK